MEETVKTKHEYTLYFLYDILEMIRGVMTIVSEDETISRLFNELNNYLMSKMTLPCGGEVIDYYITVEQKK